MPFQVTHKFIKMAKFIAFNSLVLIIATFAFHCAIVNAKISSSMYINWGAHHCQMLGEDLQLVLDKSAGKFNFLLHTYDVQIILPCVTFPCDLFKAQVNPKFRVGRFRISIILLYMYTFYI